MIELIHVTKTYRQKQHHVPAVADVSLTVEAGSVFGLIGYSGAGKSTLLRCINMLERPTSGSVVIDGVDLTHLSKRELNRTRRKIGMIFQHFHLLSSATVAENIAFPLRLARLPRQVVQKRITEMLDLVGLAGYEHKYPGALSGGQKQRVAIARALANQPNLLLCDEATSALDPETTQSILDLLADINRKLGVTIVMVAHQMEVIRQICDHVAVMADGQIVETGPVAELLVAPKHDFTRRLFGIRDTLDAQLAAEPAIAEPGRLVEVSFAGSLTYEPMLADIARETGCAFRILRGTIDTLRDVPYGRLTLQWLGDDARCETAVRALKARGCNVRETVARKPEQVEVTV